jgi:hypothetical protein
MYRLFLYWLPSLAWQVGLLVLFCLVPAVALWLASGVFPLWTLALTLFSLMAVLWRYWLYLWRFGRTTWRFRTVKGARTILRHAPELAGAIDATSLLQQTEATLPEFSRQFGFTLKRRLVIFLFATAAEVSRFFRALSAAAPLFGAMPSS